MIIDLPVRPGLRILVTSRPVDFRRGMDSLSTLVKETLATDPYAGDVFVFRAKRADRLKILVWDGSGLVLLSKRLERGRFTWPPVQDGAITLSAAQLTLLFSGVDWSHRGGRERAARRDPGGSAGQAHPPAAVWLPIL